MAGPYAHITLMHELIKSDRLEAVFSPSSGFSEALAEYFSYAVLGAVSPDYPNIARSNRSAAKWAVAMHCTQPNEMISSGIRHIRNAQEPTRNKLVAWLLGYCAHVATDVTIHPVVQAKVGVYAENQREHRICEMNQDSYIYRRMNLGEIGESDSFALIIARCGDVDDRTQLDEDIASLWHGMLQDVHPALYTDQPPSCTAWHREFVAKVSDCRAGEVRLFPLAGVISARLELPYPDYSTVDRQFVEKQLIPAKIPFHLHYDEIFDLAAENVLALWKQVERAFISQDTETLYTFENWDLDTGCDESGRLVFW